MRLHNIREGYSILPSINREKYQERDGLEGPIMTRSGKVIYYDPKAGDYIDPDTDMYLSYSDFKALDSENMHKIDEFEFNPNAGHRDQMSHPENRGLGRNPLIPSNSPTPKPRPKNLKAPMTSPRPKARPANLQMRHDINKAVRSVVGEAGGYYTQPVYDMIKQHGYPKVMAELLSKLDADVIQDFISRADLDESVSESMDPGSPELVKIFDNLKRGDRVKIKHTSYFKKYSADADEIDYIEYIVKANNVLRNGVGKVTLAMAVSPTSVKRTLFKRDGKVSMAISDMPATILDIQKVMGESEVSDEEKEKAIQRAFSKSDEPERGEKRKKVSLKRAPWEESVSEGKDETFKPHMMYDPKTGKGKMAKKEADHLKMKKMGWSHDKPKKSEIKEAEKRWKQTSMSPAEAEKEYGKANVKVKKGGLRNGDDMVQVFVEGATDVVKSVSNTYKRGLKSLTNTKNRPAKNPQPNQHTIKAGKQYESSNNPAMDKALRSIEKSFGPERKAIDDQVTAMCRTAEMLGSDRFKDRAFSAVEQYGINDKKELLQELQMMIRNEASVDDDEIHGPDSNIKRMKKAIEKIGSMQPTNEAQIMTEEQFDEAAGDKDACYRKVKSRYKVWPSAYASGALTKCRKVGAANWGNSKKK